MIGRAIFWLGLIALLARNGFNGGLKTNSAYPAGDASAAAFPDCSENSGCMIPAGLRNPVLRRLSEMRIELERARGRDGDEWTAAPGAEARVR